MSTAVLAQDILQATTDSALGSPPGGRHPGAPARPGVLRAFDAGLAVTAVGQTAAAVASLASGHFVPAALALATLPALARLRRELRRRLVRARGGWWPVSFAALATFGTLVAAALRVGSA